MSFQYVQPTDEHKATMQIFRDKYEALNKEIIEIMLTPNQSEELSLALIKLQESAMWLNKAITKND